MARKLTLQCHHCGDKFTWRHEEWPDECPLCHSYVGLDGKPEVAAPFLPTKGARSYDDVYRAMERGAEHRANVAQEMGLSREEASAMKITNMRDNVRPGETSVPTLTPQQSAMMTQALGQRASAVGNFTPDHAHPRSGLGTGIQTLARLRTQVGAR